MGLTGISDSMVLLDDAQFGVQVVTYTANAQQPEHRDRRSRITLLLRGEFAENSRHGSLAARPGDVLFKSNSVAHENRFGADGAVLVSLVFKTDVRLSATSATTWSLRRDEDVLCDAIAMLEAALANRSCCVSNAATSLLSQLNSPPTRTGSPPAWLIQLRSEVEESGFTNVDVAARAIDAGVHPAHASRLFRACFGTSITRHARYHSVRRALGLMSKKETSLRDIAVAAGFYDQSHMNRVFKRVLRRTPGAVCHLTARAARG